MKSKRVGDRLKIVIIAKTWTYFYKGGSLHTTAIMGKKEYVLSKTVVYPLFFLILFFSTFTEAVLMTWQSARTRHHGGARGGLDA